MTTSRRRRTSGRSAAGARRRASAPTLTVWFYDSAMGAAAGELRLKELQQRGAVTVLDAVTIAWMTGAHTPRVGHLVHRRSTAPVEGSILGAFVDALLLAPAVGSGPAAELEALAQGLLGTGIDRQFLADTRARLRPGTSALLVLSADSDLDSVRLAIERGRARGDVTLMYASLPPGAPAFLAQLLDPADRSSSGTCDR